MKHWWQPLYSLVPGIAEETVAQLFLTTLCYALLRPTTNDHPRRATIASVLIGALTHGLAHLYVFQILSPAGAMMIIMGLMYGVPMALLFIKRDLEHAIGYHFFIDFVDAPNTPFELRGLASYKRFEATFIKGFPDYQDAIEDIIAEGDRVWVLGRVTGTHTGEWEFLGIEFAPTGKKITWTAVNMFLMVDGKIVERKSVRDMSDFLKQLGVIEYTEKARHLFPEE